MLWFLHRTRAITTFKFPGDKNFESDAHFFDIDGTLLVTRDLVHWNGLLKVMLEIYGTDTTIDGLLYHGKTDIAILRMALNRCGLPDSEFDSCIPCH